MNEFTPEHKKAFALSSLLTAAMVVVLLMLAVQSGVFERVLPTGQDEPAVPTEDQKAMEAAVQTYIKTLPSYDMAAQPELLFSGIQVLGDNVRQVRMDSQRSMLGLNVQQHFRVLYQDGRVIGHEVWHSSGLLEVHTPEPEQIISGDIVVRGQAQPNTPVTITITPQGDATTVLAESMTRASATGEFAATFSQQTAATNIVIVVQAGDDTIKIPVSIDTYAASN